VQAGKPLCPAVGAVRDVWRVLEHSERRRPRRLPVVVGRVRGVLPGVVGEQVGEDARGGTGLGAHGHNAEDGEEGEAHGKDAVGAGATLREDDWRGGNGREKG